MREVLLRFGDTAKFRGIGKHHAVTREQSREASIDAFGGHFCGWRTTSCVPIRFQGLGIGITVALRTPAWLA